jgi:hypothetical protein
LSCLNLPDSKEAVLTLHLLIIQTPADQYTISGVISGIVL